MDYRYFESEDGDHCYGVTPDEESHIAHAFSDLCQTRAASVSPAQVRKQAGVRVSVKAVAAVMRAYWLKAHPEMETAR